MLAGRSRAGNPGRYTGLVLLAGIAVPAAAEPVRVALDASIVSTYDSNLFRIAPSEMASGGYRSIDDNITVPRGAAQLHAAIGLQTIDASASVGYRLHHLNTALNSFDYDLNARLNYRLPIACKGTARLEQLQRLSDYRDFLGAPRRVIVRARTSGIDGTCSITPRIAVTGSGEYRTRENFDPQLAVFNLEETELRGEVSYGDAETIQPFVAIRNRLRAQPNFITTALPDGSHATIWDAGGGARWEPSEYLKLAAAGYWSRLRENSHLRDTTTVSATFTADWEVTGKTSIHLTADTGIDVAPSIGAVAYTTRGGSLQIVWKATPKIEATVSADYRHRDLIRDRIDLRLIRFERDDTVTVDAGVAYRVTDTLLARAGIGYRDRRANFEDITFRAKVATVGLTYRFAGPPLDVPSQ